MYQTMLRSYLDLHYYMWSSDALQSLKNTYPTPEEWDTMREMDALLRSTQILLMNLQTNTPPAVAISPLLVCFAQSKLPSTSSDLVRNIVCLTSNNQHDRVSELCTKIYPKRTTKQNFIQDRTMNDQIPMLLLWMYKLVRQQSNLKLLLTETYKISLI